MSQRTDLNSQNKESNETLLLAEIFDHIPSGLILVDRAGKIFRANPAAQKLLGGDLIGDAWLTVIQRVFCLRDDDGHEVSLRDGRRVQVSTLPLKHQPGQMVQITDLTETRRLQEQVGHMQRLSALGKMAASLAHQIRTPLSAAMLYGANLANRTLSPESRLQFQQKLMDRLKELERQVSDVLLFARNGDQQKVEPVVLSDLLNQLQQRAESLLHHHGAALNINAPKKEINLLLNSEAITSALMNLLENAIQAEGKQLLLTVEPEADHVMIRLVDNGKGISREQLSRIFEPFYTTRSKGTGLGLAVVQAVIQAHQGTIQASSLVGEGSCLSIRLPYHHVQLQQVREGAA
jgi:two-component system, sensor histidine kinase FlrB